MCGGQEHGLRRLNPGTAVTSCVTWENYLISLCFSVYVNQIKIKVISRRATLLLGWNEILHTVGAQ